MMIHQWMHWFWITHAYPKGLFIIVISQVITSAVVISPGQSLEAGLQRPVPFQAASQYHPYHSSHGSRLSRNVQDEADEVGDEEGDVPWTTTSSSPDTLSTSHIPSSSSPLPPSSSPYSPDFSSRDLEDTFNGDNTDLFLPYPQKKYHSKYTETAPSKYYEKFKVKPKNEGGEIRVYETRVDIHMKRGQEEGVGLDNETSTEGSNVTRNATETSLLLSDEPEQLSSSTTTESDVEDVEDVLSTEEVEETALHSTLEPFIFSNKMAAAATSAENRERLHTSALDAGSITGITLGLVVVCGLFGAISFVLYRRRYLNKPQVLNDKSSNLDSSGYIDDTSLRENSEEMYSLDNDSFLNSLEAMTIQNYWTESVKHTKL